MLRAAVFTAILFLVSAPLGASIIKIPPKTQGETTYETLVCSDQHREYIGELITAMGEQSWVSLFKNRKRLEFIGAQITPVHPLKFLGTIFSNPTLKKEMGSIFDDFLKRGKLLDGLIPNLEREADKGTLNGYLPDFAKEVHVSPDLLRSYFERRDWEGMVRFLNQTPS